MKAISKEDFLKLVSEAIDNLIDKRNDFAKIMIHIDGMGNLFLDRKVSNAYSMAQVLTEDEIKENMKRLYEGEKLG